MEVTQADTTSQWACTLPGVREYFLLAPDMSNQPRASSLIRALRRLDTKFSWVSRPWIEINFTFLSNSRMSAPLPLEKVLYKEETRWSTSLSLKKTYRPRVEGAYCKTIAYFLHPLSTMSQMRARSPTWTSRPKLRIASLSLPNIKSKRQRVGRVMPFLQIKSCQLLVQAWPSSTLTGIWFARIWWNTSRQARARRLSRSKTKSKSSYKCLVGVTPPTTLTITSRTSRCCEASRKTLACKWLERTTTWVNQLSSRPPWSTLTVLQMLLVRAKLPSQSARNCRK